MKILYLANPDSVHTNNWVNTLSEEGVDIYIFGLNNSHTNNYHKNVRIESLNISTDITEKPDSSLKKIVYFKSLGMIKELINKIKPDILHAHYLSSYGLLGALSNFKPYIISVWGSDIYFAPKRNVIQKKLIEYSLSKADLILSTSFSMKELIKSYTSKEIIVTPFGVDTLKFHKLSGISYFNNDCIVIGTIKALEERYGIEYLIRSFRFVKDKLPTFPLKLLIVGKGTQETYLKGMVSKLNLENDTIFSGFIPLNKIPEFHNMIDIFVTLSTEYESFGVSVLEAMACENPVVVSDVGGYLEIVQNNKTGIIVEKKNIQSTTEAIIKMITDKNLREQMGKAGRQFVLDNYNWNKSVNQMLGIYRDIVKCD